MLRKPGDATRRSWGLTENLEEARQWLLQNLVTPHTAAIPKDRVFDQALPCGQKHPGFCKLDWAGDDQAAHSAICRCLRAWSVGDLISIAVTEVDGTTRVSYKRIVCLQDADCIVLLRLDMADSKLILGRSNGSTFDFEMSQVAVHKAWHACGSNPTVVVLERYCEGAAEPQTLEDALRPWQCSLPDTRQTHQVWPVCDEVRREQGVLQSAKAKWMESVMRDLQAPVSSAICDDQDSDEDSPAMKDMQSIKLQVLEKQLKISNSKLRASKVILKKQAAIRARAKAKARSKADNGGRHAADPLPHDEQVEPHAPIADKPLTPAANGPARVEAVPPKANQVVINGRMFTKLKRGGLSLQCALHVGEDCAKDIGYTAEVDEAEAVKRLLIWETLGVGLTRDEHVDRGGRRFGRSLRNVV